MAAKNQLLQMREKYKRRKSKSKQRLPRDISELRRAGSDKEQHQDKRAFFRLSSDPRYLSPIWKAQGERSVDIARIV
jgi:hypothetical protein